MKSNAVVVILILACVGLGGVLLVDNKNHETEKQHMDDTIAHYSNQVTTLEKDHREQIDVNVSLSNTIVALKSEAVRASNDLAAAQSGLSTAQAGLKEAQDAAEAARAAAAKAATEAAADLAARDQKINDLESQNQDLDKTSNELRASITNKEAEIQAKEKELAQSKDYNESLSNELVRLKAEKADLEKKFNDLAALKEQVTKLKDDLTLARKLDWIRRGIYNSITVKGGERLIHPETSAPPATNGGLSVELHQNGGVSVGASGATNAPPGN
jgi:chromosome segregation ATPase